MNDFITMQCPNCGAPLEISRKTKTLKCEACGTKHAVPNQIKEIFQESPIACPVCHRSDKIEKISALLKESTGITYQNILSSNEIGSNTITVQQTIAVPSASSFSPEIKSLLQAPEKPRPRQNLGYSQSNSALIAALITLGFSLFCGFPSFIGIVSIVSEKTIRNDDVIGFVFCLVTFGTLLTVGLLILFIGVPSEKRANLRKKALVENQQRIINEENQRNLADWNRAMERWNKLYYCVRDDCVFLPDADTYAPISNIKDYLYCSDIASYKPISSSTYSVSIGGKTYVCPDRSTLLSWYQSGRVLADTDVYEHSIGVWKKAKDLLTL